MRAVSKKAVGVVLRQSISGVVGNVYFAAVVAGEVIVATIARQDGAIGEEFEQILFRPTRATLARKRFSCDQLEAALEF